MADLNATRTPNPAPGPAPIPRMLTRMVQPNSHRSHEPPDHRHPAAQAATSDDGAQAATSDDGGRRRQPEAAADRRTAASRSRQRVARSLIGGEDEHVEVLDVVAPTDPVPVDTRDYIQFSPDHATRIRVLAGTHLALDLWCIEPQQSTGVVQFPDSDVVYMVVAGRSWFVTERGDVGLDALGSLMVPAGTVHGIDNRGADPLIMSMAMAPTDGLEPSVGDGPAEAIRDDSKYGSLGRTLRTQWDRLLGR